MPVPSAKRHESEHGQEVADISTSAAPCGPRLVVKGFDRSSPLFRAGPGSYQRGAAYEVPAPREASSATPVTPGV
jgi:hypothetical protein